MPGPQFVHRAVCLFATAALFVFFLPHPAAADSADVVSQTFSGTAACIVASCGSGTSIASSFNLDQDSNSASGPWSFTAPMGLTYPDPNGKDGSAAMGLSFLEWTGGYHHSILKIDGDDGPSPVATPEPSSIVLLTIGVLALFLIVRRPSFRGPRPA